MAQLKGLADAPVAVIPAVAKADAMAEKNAEISVSSFDRGSCPK